MDSPGHPDRRCVLVVDDERNMRTTLGDILGDEGFDVITAESGERALRLCRERVPDIVLLDVRLPGIDGVETARRLRAERPELPVVLMSAYSLEHIERQALAEGAQAFLRKPLDAEALIALLHRIGGRATAPTERP